MKVGNDNRAPRSPNAAQIHSRGTVRGFRRRNAARQEYCSTNVQQTAGKNWRILIKHFSEQVITLQVT